MFGVFVAIRLVFLRSSFGVFAQFAIPYGPLRQRKFKIELPSQVQGACVFENVKAKKPKQKR